MSLALVKSHLDTTFRKLGTTKDAKSAPPSSDDNRFSIAWEYFVADFLCSIATKRKEVAKKAAEEAGVISKPGVGETETVYRTDGLQIVGQTKTPAKRLDQTKLNAELTKRYGLDVAREIISLATSESAAATTYSFVSE